MAAQKELTNRCRRSTQRGIASHTTAYRHRAKNANVAPLQTTAAYRHQWQRQIDEAQKLTVETGMFRQSRLIQMRRMRQMMNTGDTNTLPDIREMMPMQ